MIRTLHRFRGASALGAQRPGEPGPFGVHPDADEDDETDSTGVVMTSRTEGGRHDDR